MDTETKKIIDGLTKRLTDLESKYKQHLHTGLDVQKVLFKDLGTITYTETTIDPGSLVDGAGETQSVTIEGVNLGDFVLVSGYGICPSARHGGNTNPKRGRGNSQFDIRHLENYCH